MRAGQRTEVRPGLDRPLVEAERRQGRAELQGGSNRRAGVDDLVAADEGRQRQIEKLVLRLHHEAPALLEGIEMLAPRHQRRADRLGLGADHARRLRLLLRDDDRNARAQDARLLVGDLGERATRASRSDRARSA